MEADILRVILSSFPLVGRTAVIYASLYLFLDLGRRFVRFKGELRLVKTLDNNLWLFEIATKDVCEPHVVLNASILLFIWAHRGKHPELSRQRSECRRVWKLSISGLMGKFCSYSWCLLHKAASFSRYWAEAPSHHVPCRKRNEENMPGSSTNF